MSAPVLPDDQIDVPAVAVPDRADAPISEITERFFRALLTKVPLERIEEVHLFSPLRSGGVETGIAVIAAREIVVAPEMVDEPLPLALEDTSATSAEAEPAVADATAETGDVESVVDDPTAESDEVEPAVVDARVEAVAESPYADEEPTTEFEGAVAVVEVADVEVHFEPLQSNVGGSTAVVVATPVVRHTVYTARYRLVQKGPERGKWESNVVAEAEAPLITVETVVRGVQRRAGEESETTRFSAAQLARALRIELTVGA